KPQFLADSFDNTGQLDAQNWRHVQFIEQVPDDRGTLVQPTPIAGGQAWLMMSDVCKHCKNASCLEVCPTGAITRTEFDTVFIQQDVCNGCRNCISACPYGVIGFNDQTGTVHKCTLCYDRLQTGMQPACAKACPTESIQFGYIEDLHAAADKRLANLKQAGYAKAQLYGRDEKVYGGLNAFFLGGLAGGSYAIGTLLRIAGDARDESAARIAYVASFIALIPCPIFLALDLGQPIRFWHMLVDTSDGGLSFNVISPMSVGSWALVLFGLFSFVSFLGALADMGRLPAARPIASVLRGGPGIVWGVFGTAFGVFICGYTGVLLAVSNQPVWRDGGWVLGGLFLASALAGSAALLLLLARSRRAIASDTEARIAAADRMFVILEAILIVLFCVLLVLADTVLRVLGVWILLWIVVLVGLLAPLVSGWRPDLARRWPPLAAPVLALLGVLALRAVVIFSAQFG